MLQSNLLQFHNPTHRNTSGSDPRSHHTQGSGVGHIYTWIMHTEYKVCLGPPLNKELVKMLYFHYRNIRQLFGEQRNVDWLRHDDPCASSCQGQHVFLIIFIIIHIYHTKRVLAALLENGTSIFNLTWVAIFGQHWLTSGAVTNEITPSHLSAKLC